MSCTPDAEALGLHLSLITTALGEIVAALEEQTDTLQSAVEAIGCLTEEEQREVRLYGTT